MQGFENLLIKAIEDVLNTVLGEVPAKIILQRLKISDSLDLMIFSDVLEKTLGSSAFLIENLILKSLYSKLELRFEEKEGYKFLDYIKELRRKNMS